MSLLLFQLMFPIVTGESGAEVSRLQIGSDGFRSSLNWNVIEIISLSGRTHLLHLQNVDSPVQQHFSFHILDICTPAQSHL